MKIHVGYELVYQCPQPTPMLLTLNLHYTRASDVMRVDHIVTQPPLPISAYRDGFGNWCSRIVAPAGTTRISTNALIRDGEARGLPSAMIEIRQDGIASQAAAERWAERFKSRVAV